MDEHLEEPMDIRLIAAAANTSHFHFQRMFALISGMTVAEYIRKRRLIPPLTWAVFPGKGKMPDSIQVVWKRIFSEWFPAMDYEHAEGPELEVYLPEPCDDGESSFEVWIPIVKK